ncbi:MAG: 4Fe-4S binding protein [Bacillota bacterium]
MKRNFNIKTNRTFTWLRRYAWIFTLTVAFGGLWEPKLGLLVIPVILGLVSISFFRGRYWCGNFCAHGSLFDALVMPISRNQSIPALFRSKITGLLFFGWFSYNLVRKLLRVSALYGKAPFLDKLGFIFVASYLMVTIVGGLLSIFVAPRTWCQFCPMGFMQRYSYRLGKLLGVAKNTDRKITMAGKEKCHSCGKCARVCPMQLKPYLDFTPGNQFDHEDCIRCNTCVYNCPAHILSLSTEKEAAEIAAKTSLQGYDTRKRVSARLERIRDLNQDVKELTFEFIKPQTVDYKPGQFMLVKIEDQPEMYRAYSISSHNHDRKRVKVTVKRVPNGYGTGIIFDQFKEGETVELQLPMGDELVVDKSAEKILLVGGGIGITPFIPIVEDLVKGKNSAKEIDLIYGVNRANELIYDQELTAMADGNPHFRYTKVVASDSSWSSGPKGFVTDIIKDMDLSGYKVYMCGPKPMTDATTKLLQAMGVPEKNIFMETA